MRRRQQAWQRASDKEPRYGRAAVRGEGNMSACEPLKNNSRCFVLQPVSCLRCAGVAFTAEPMMTTTAITASQRAHDDTGGRGIFQPAGALCGGNSRQTRGHVGGTPAQLRTTLVGCREAGDRLGLELELEPRAGLPGVTDECLTGWMAGSAASNGRPCPLRGLLVRVWRAFVVGLPPPTPLAVGVAGATGAVGAAGVAGGLWCAVALLGPGQHRRGEEGERGEERRREDRRGQERGGQERRGEERRGEERRGGQERRGEGGEGRAGEERRGVGRREEKRREEWGGEERRREEGRAGEERRGVGRREEGRAGEERRGVGRRGEEEERSGEERRGEERRGGQERRGEERSGEERRGDERRGGQERRGEDRRGEERRAGEERRRGEEWGGEERRGEEERRGVGRERGEGMRGEEGENSLQPADWSGSPEAGPTVTITCADGKWNKQVSCEPVDCGLPDKYHVHPAIFDFPEGTTYGKKTTFQCKEPAQLVGTNNTLTCMEDGLWSFPEALCELRCPAPPAVPNAVLQTKRCNETGLKVGSLCKYKCKPGYHVTNKPKRRAFKRQCTEDGTWLEGGCEPVTCDAPAPVFHGMYQCTDAFRFDSTCWIHCNGANHTGRQHPPCKQGPNTNVIRCRKDGNWTGSFHICPQMKGQCSLPQNLHPNIRVSCRKGYGIGEECELSCRDPNNNVVTLPDNITADDILKHHWLNPPKVKSIVCTMGLKWYPHPEVLHCIKGCEPFMGDNYCDAINNRAFCNYDGGDCCHSTVKTKKVQSPASSKMFFSFQRS
ncbi:hypothetical protein ACEWY4_004715 [Coilia grayii]|uniref:Pappalysin-1 n=1 Tax=Coilia grayii TaxID=363190 RepID=A0ABD1KMW7_9TELE